MSRAYFDKKLDRVVWDHEPEYDNPNDRGPAMSAHVYTQNDGCYVDLQLPRNCEEHKAAGGKFTADGKCIMTGWKQIRETEARCNGNGQHPGRLRYDAPHRSR